MDDDNPYRPPIFLNTPVALNEPLRFDGEITTRDYRRMLATKLDRAILWVFWGLAFTLTAPLLATIVMVQIYNVPGPSPQVLGASAMVFLLIWGAIYWLSPMARSQRYIREHPEVLGRVRGTLEESGLCLERLDKRHWFAWSTLHEIAVRSDGIRVNFDDNPLRFLAITRDMLSSNYRAHADAIVTKFANRIRTLEELQIDCGAVFGRSIEDPCFFRGKAASIRSLKTQQQLLVVATQMITGLAVTAGGLASSGYGRVIILLGLCCIAFGAWELWRYGYGASVTEHEIWGWADATIFVCGLDAQATEYPVATLQHVRRAGDSFEFRITRNDRLQVNLDSLQDPDAFAATVAVWRLLDAE